MANVQSFCHRVIRLTAHLFTLSPCHLVTLSSLFLLAGCFTLSGSNGGGEGVSFQGPRRVSAADVALPPGYTITPLAIGLCYPTGVCFDDHGGVFITEAGGADRVPRLLKINSDGSTTAIATGSNPPWNGVTFYKGDFFVSEGGALTGGKILKISPDGQISSLVENLPSQGEFQTSGPLISDDGYIYFGQGSATNSGIAGLDDDSLGWLPINRRFHDIPGADIKLTGVNVETADPLGTGSSAVTGAFSPFGQPTAAGQIAPGQVPCTGAIMRIPVAGGAPELVAWGFRNPFGLAFAPGNKLFITEQSYEDRGSRPVSGCGDLLWEVKPALWYGWPDFHGDLPLAGSAQFWAAGKPQPQPLLAEYPNLPPKPAAILAMHAGAAGLDFSREASFGHVGEAFVAEFGDLAPLAGKLTAPVGFDVIRIDPATGVSHVFAANKDDRTGPASKLGSAGLERPIAARFDQTGTSLYVVDYGVVLAGNSSVQKPIARPDTGVLWKITKATP